MASKIDRIIEAHPIPGIVVGALLALVGLFLAIHISGILFFILACGVMGAGLGAAGGGVRSLLKAKKKDE